MRVPAATPPAVMAVPPAAAAAPGKKLPDTKVWPAPPTSARATGKVARNPVIRKRR
jgi:hypothetical protein